MIEHGKFVIVGGQRRISMNSRNCGSSRHLHGQSTSEICGAGGGVLRVGEGGGDKFLTCVLVAVFPVDGECGR